MKQKKITTIENINMKEFKKFIKGDIIAKKEDVGMHWGVFPSQLILVIGKIESSAHMLIHRPWYNWLRYPFIKL